MFQISACLRRMNMDRYVEPFAQEQIDGQLLLALTDEDLKNAFGMNGTERAKLKMFAHRQWRPKGSIP